MMYFGKISNPSNVFAMLPTDSQKRQSTFDLKMRIYWHKNGKNYSNYFERTMSCWFVKKIKNNKYLQYLA